MDPVPDRQIFITGFMATGKSKIGPIVANCLGRSYVDTDDLIQEVAAKTIPEIFEEDGEAAFRKIEQDCVRKASGMQNSVIALGGGVVTHEANWETIRSTGICICLCASPETINRRVARSRERPLLDGLNEKTRMEKIRELLAEREPFYSRADLFVTSTENRKPEDTAELVVEALMKFAQETGDRESQNPE